MENSSSTMGYPGGEGFDVRIDLDPTLTRGGKGGAATRPRQPLGVTAACTAFCSFLGVTMHTLGIFAASYYLLYFITMPVVSYYEPVRTPAGEFLSAEDKGD